MKYVKALIIIIALAAGLLAQGDAHALYGTMQNNDGTTPSSDCLRFNARWTYGSNVLFFPADSCVGCGTGYNTEGIWLVETSSFTPSPQTGDTVFIYFWNICNGEHYYIECIVDMSHVYQIFDITLGIEESPKPEEVRVEVFPNPFNATCRIICTEDVGIYDISGRLLKTLTGINMKFWDGKSDKGETMPAGIYFVKSANGKTAEKVLMLK